MSYDLIVHTIIVENTRVASVRAGGWPTFPTLVFVDSHSYWVPPSFAFCAKG